MADRKKPSQMRSTQTVTDILQATAEVVSDIGVSRVTIEKIAQRAGLSPGSIYQYFTCKDSILGSFVVNELQNSRERSIGLLKNTHHLPMHQIIPIAVGAMAIFYTERANVYTNVYSHSARFGKTADLMDMRREVVTELVAVLRKHEKEIVVNDPEIAAVVVINGVMGIFSAPLLDPSLPYSPADLCDDAIDLVNAYLLGSKAALRKL